MQGVYILEFSTEIGNQNHSAKYYIGYARDIDQRLNEHKKGLGAAITRYAVENDIEFKVIVTFPGQDRSFERKLKNRKNTKLIVDRAKRGTLRVKEYVYHA